MWRKSERGFTLVEILLALVILATAGAIALNSLVTANTSVLEQKVRAQVNEDARNLMEQLTQDIRDAGFGAILNSLGDVSANAYFLSAFDDIYSGSETASDGIILRAIKMGAEIDSEMPADSAILKVDKVDAFLPYNDSYALVYQNGEFQVLQISKVMVQPSMIQHNKDKVKWRIPSGSPVYRLDEIQWSANGETVERRVNVMATSTGTLTHTFPNVRSLKIKYVLQDGSMVNVLDSSNYGKLMCIDVTLDIYRWGGRGDDRREFHVNISQRVAPRNL